MSNQPSLAFPLHIKSRLKSNTCLILSRIFSVPADKLPPPLAPAVDVTSIPQNHTPGIHYNEVGLTTENESHNETLLPQGILNSSLLPIQKDFAINNQYANPDVEKNFIKDSVHITNELRGGNVLSTASNSGNVVVEPAGVHEIQRINKDNKVDSSTSHVLGKEIEEGEIPHDVGRVFSVIQRDDPVDSTRVGVVADKCLQKELHVRNSVVKEIKTSKIGVVEVGRDKVECNEAKELDKRPIVNYDDLGYPSVETDGKLSAEKGNNMDRKRKRTKTPEAKAKKKLKERKKRAKKERESGVKRLKLQPISKPKTVKICNFYLNGRCKQEGSCKFSHDAIPLTKSQPCNFFARHTCLKGDDCPFDHQLSKYPCNKYQANGFCSRGAECLFSHKIEGSSPALAAKGTSSEASSLQHSANSGKQLMKGNTPYQTPNMCKKTLMSPASVGGSNTRQTGQKVVDMRLKPLVHAPKGISFLSTGKVPSDDPSKQPQGDMPPSLGNISATVCSWKKQGASEKFHEPNETPRASSHSRSQSSEMISDVKSKDVPNSAQKALSSALAFASRYESKIVGSTKSPALSVESNKLSKSSNSSSGGLLNGPMTVTEILNEFLFGGGGGGSGVKKSLGDNI